MKALNKVSDFVTGNLTWVVLAVVAVGYLVPQSFTWAATRTTPLLCLVMFGMGMTLTAADFKTAFSRPKEVLVGCAAQFLIMPLLAYGLTRLFGLSGMLAAGMILVGTCPGGTSSNVMTYLAKGDVALSVCMTMASTLLAPLVTPMLTWALAGQWVEVSFFAMLKSVVKVVLVPIALGLAAHKVLGSGFVNRVAKLLVLVSACCVLSIMGAMVAVNGSAIVAAGAVLVVVVLLQNLLGYALGGFMAGKLGMTGAKQTTVAIEVGMQNAALACTLANAHFTAGAAVPGAVAGVCHQITGSILASVMARRNEKKTEAVAPVYAAPEAV